MAFPVAPVAKHLLPMQETEEKQVWSLGWEDPLQEGTTTHSSILAWRVPWAEEPGGLHGVAKSWTQRKQPNMHACIVTKWISCSTEGNQEMRSMFPKLAWRNDELGCLFKIQTSVSDEILNQYFGVEVNDLYFIISLAIVFIWQIGKEGTEWPL